MDNPYIGKIVEMSDEGGEEYKGVLKSPSKGDAPDILCRAELVHEEGPIVYLVIRER